MSLVAYIVLYGVLVLGVLAMLKLIFKDAVNSETPFTEKQADRLRFIAFLALMFALLEFAFTLGVTFYWSQVKSATPKSEINRQSRPI